MTLDSMKRKCYPIWINATSNSHLLLYYICHSNTFLSPRASLLIVFGHTALPMSTNNKLTVQQYNICIHQSIHQELLGICNYKEGYQTRTRWKDYRIGTAQLLLSKQQQIQGGIYTHWHFSSSTDKVVLPTRLYQQRQTRWHGAQLNLNKNLTLQLWSRVTM